MFWKSAATASLLATRVHAGSMDLGLNGLDVGRRGFVLDERVGYIAEGDVAQRQPNRHVIVRRQSGDSGVLLNGDGTINMAVWDDEANRACMASLTGLPSSTNPSGTAVCYNLPALNNITGAFEADLRLYQVSEPSGQFTGIPPQNIMVALSYNGASVSPVSASTARQGNRPDQQSRRQEPSATPSAPATAPVGPLRLLQAYLFVGQIDRNRMTPDIRLEDIEAFVMPVVTLTAVNGAGQTVSTNVSSNEAAFVTGEFSKAILMSDFALANASVARLVSDLTSANPTVAFVLPGVQLMLFPIGLIITSIWLVTGLVVIGFGTYERINYREMYRQRQARVGKPTQNRI